MTNLGTIGIIICLARQYAAGSFQVDVTFTMFGLQFRAQRFVRTDAHGACDSIYLFSVPPAGAFEGYDEYLKTVAADDADPVARRARHLIAVAPSRRSRSASERFAQI